MRQLVTVLVAVVACAPVAASQSGSAPSSPGSSASVLQMNLCLSGQAGCFEQTAYPAVLDEAVARIDDVQPGAVTVNEACRGDAAELARRSGYELSFAAVDYGGAPLPCIDPRGRGVFGIAVLTRDGVSTTADRPFAVQADPEERRWLCATTVGGLTFCTAHLGTRMSHGEQAANDAECRELRQVLARYGAAGTTFFGGDVNRQSSCAPSSMWSTRDVDASQSRGVQHVYGSTTVPMPSTTVTEAAYTDHDFLLAATTTAPAG